MIISGIIQISTPKTNESIDFDAILNDDLAKTKKVNGMKNGKNEIRTPASVPSTKNAIKICLALFEIEYDSK